MGDKADIGLVDPHAESDRRHDDDAFLAQKALLMPLAHRRIEPGMVGQGVAPAGLQPGGRLLDCAAR